MPAATNAQRATAEKALIMTVPCHGPLRPFIDGRSLSGAGFRMSSPVRETVSCRRVLCRPRPGDETLSARVEDAATQPGGSGTCRLVPAAPVPFAACASRRGVLRTVSEESLQTEVESWRNLQSANIEFTMKRLREPRCPRQ